MIFLITTSVSSVENVLKLIGLIILCGVIIAASYFTTRFVGRKEAGISANSNFKPLDIMRLSQNKYLQIIQVGKRYFVIAVCKDTVTYLAELNEEDIVFRKDEPTKLSFKEIMSKVTAKGAKKEDSAELGSDIPENQKKEE